MEIKLTYDQAHGYREAVELRIENLTAAREKRDAESLEIVRSRYTREKRIFLGFEIRAKAPPVDLKITKDDHAFLLERHSRKYPTKMYEDQLKTCKNFILALDHGFEQMTIYSKDLVALVGDAFL